MFRKKCNIIDHMRVHTGDRPFKCFYCRKSFSQKGNLNKHIKSVHKISEEELEIMEKKQENENEMMVEEEEESEDVEKDQKR
jgi:uncharacterized Zn-finger protein